MRGVGGARRGVGKDVWKRLFYVVLRFVFVTPGTGLASSTFVKYEDRLFHNQVIGCIIFQPCYVNAFQPKAMIGLKEIQIV